MTELLPSLRVVLEKYAKLIIENYRKELTKNGHNASYTLSKSLSYEVSNSGNLYSLSLGLEDYWKYIESGTKPHFPPPSRILDWIRIKPIAPRPMKNGKLPTLPQLAYLIGRKISLYGTKGTNDLEHAEDSIWEKFMEEIDEAITKDISNNFDEILKIVYN